MNDSCIVDRRDPFSSILQLGSTLVQACDNRLDKIIRLTVKHDVYSIILSSGKIRRVTGPQGIIDYSNAAELFALPRHLISSATCTHAFVHPNLFDPAELVLNGLHLRKDLLNAAVLESRIPVDSLQLSQSQIDALLSRPFLTQDIPFLAQLRKETPVQQIIWDSGIAPQRAAILITYLNVLGMWHPLWKQGDFPRGDIANQVLGQSHRSVNPHQILGLHVNATQPNIDKAFRILSFQLHPDRNRSLSERNRSKFTKAFTVVSDAHQRLRSQTTSRRKPFVTPTVRQDNWQHIFSLIETAFQHEDLQQARKHAICGLLKNPPPAIRRKITELLRSAA